MVVDTGLPIYKAMSIIQEDRKEIAMWESARDVCQDTSNLSYLSHFDILACFRNDKNPVVVAVRIDRDEEESVFLVAVAEADSPEYLAVIENDPYLQAAEPRLVDLLEELLLDVGTVPVEGLDEEDRLQLRNPDLLYFSAAVLEREMERVIERSEIVRVSLLEGPVTEMNDYLVFNRV